MAKCKKTFEERWRQEELLAEKYTQLQPCVDRGLRTRKNFIVQNVEDEDMTFVVSSEESSLIRDIYSKVIGDLPIMFLGMKVIIE